MTLLPSFPLACRRSGRHRTSFSVCVPSLLPPSVPVWQRDFSRTEPSVGLPRGLPRAHRAVRVGCGSGAGRRIPSSSRVSSSLCEHRLLRRPLAVVGTATPPPRSRPLLSVWFALQLFPPRSTAPYDLPALRFVGALLRWDASPRVACAALSSPSILPAVCVSPALQGLGTSRIAP